LTLFLAALVLAAPCISFAEKEIPAAKPEEVKYLKETLVPLAYEPSRDVSLDILKRFPPEKYHYVTAGRSPTMIQAILEELAPESVTSLPISGLTTHVKAGAAENVEEALVRHFRERLPKSEKLKGKKLLFIDYTATGISLQKEIDLAEKARPGVTAEGYLLGNPRHPPPFRSTVHFNESTANGKLNETLQREVYDKWARYGEVPADRLTSTSFEVPKNPNYNTLKSAVRSLMRKDETLHIPKAPVPPEIAQKITQTLTYDYEGFQKTAQELLEVFPPDKYYYVGVGRSPTMLMSMLEEMGVKGAEIPLSNVRGYEKIRNEATDKALKEHLKRYIPSPEELKGRKILMIDFPASGKTFSNVSELLRDAMREAGHKEPPEGLFLGRDPSWSPRETIRIKTHNLVRAVNEIQTGLLQGDFDKLGRYETFDAEKLTGTGNLPAPEENPHYSTFREELRERMSRDSFFKTQLKKSCGAKYSILAR